MSAPSEPDSPVESPRGKARSARIRVLLRPIVSVGRLTYGAWREDRTHRLGAGLAYYALFTLAPLLALTAALAEWLFGSADMQAYLSARLEQLGLVESDAAGTALAAQLEANSVQSTLGIIGVTSLLLASSVFFLAFADAVNVIWKVPVGSGVWNSVRRRLVAFVMVLVTGGVLVAGLAVSALTSAVDALLPGEPEVLESMADSLVAQASWISLSLALAMLFRFLPPVRVRWRWSLVAGLSTALLLTISTAAISWYLRNFGGASIPGAFGAVLAALSWIYIQAQILLAGVQLVKILVNTRPDEFVESRPAA